MGTRKFWKTVIFKSGIKSTKARRKIWSRIGDSALQNNIQSAKKGTFLVPPIFEYLGGEFLALIRQIVASTVRFKSRLLKTKNRFRRGVLASKNDARIAAYFGIRLPLFLKSSEGFNWTNTINGPTRISVFRTLLIKSKD